MEQEMLDRLRLTCSKLKQKSTIASDLLIVAQKGRHGAKVYTIFDETLEAMEDMIDMIQSLETENKNLRDKVACLLEK